MGALTPLVSRLIHAAGDPRPRNTRQGNDMRHPPADPGPPVLRARVLVVTSQPVVSAGINGLLVGRHGDLVVTTEGPEDGEPDVVFFDVIELHNGDGTDLDHWISQTSSVVIAVTRELRPDLGSEAVERGAAG